MPNPYLNCMCRKHYLTWDKFVIAMEATDHPLANVLRTGIEAYRDT